MYESHSQIPRSLLFLFIFVVLAACQQINIDTKAVEESLATPNIDYTPVKTSIRPTNTPTALLPTITPFIPTPVSGEVNEPNFTPTPLIAISPTLIFQYETIEWLVFESQREDTNEDGSIDFQDGIHLYAMELEAEEPTQLTFGNHHDIHPVWSPNQSQIAFVSNRAGGFDLHVMNNDGTNIQQLTNTPDNETVPKWSPDGTQIAYITVQILADGEQRKTLHLIDAESGETRQLYNEGDKINSLDWSPDGSFLVFWETRKQEQGNGTIHYEEQIKMLQMTTKQIFHLQFSRSKEVYFSNPQWLPRMGYFLSLEQVPGDFSSSSIKIFEIAWENDQPTAQQVFVLEDAYGAYTWGSNGERLITVTVSDHRYSSETSERQLHDLTLVSVDFSSQDYSSSAVTSTTYYYSIRTEGKLITDNNYYDDHPDWVSGMKN